MQINEFLSVEMTISIFQLGAILIILGLLLNNWKPPIKEQYVFIMLGVAGMILGFLLGCGIGWGFIWAGIVFYKSKLVEEFKLLKESLSNLKELREVKDSAEATEEEIEK